MVHKRWFLSLSLMLAATLLATLFAQSAQANSSAQSLPFNQDWTNTGLITANDNWVDVAGIEGYLGQDLTTTTGADPQTLLTVSSIANDLDVIANQTNTSISSGGVAEFEIADPAIALQGSGTADAPYIVLYLNTSGKSNVSVAYNLRDLDGSADNATQQVALQYRVGSSGNFTNIPAGYVADATTGPGLATLVTPVSATLPAAANNQPEVQVRVITTNAAGNDEWVGIDGISITGNAIVDPSPSATATPETPTPVACSAPDTAIGAVQGSGAATTMSGSVTVQGVVVGDYEGASPALRGFYLQDSVDGDPQTSDGIFVFEGDNANRVSVGQVVQVNGTIGENQGQTQLNSTTGIELCGTTAAIAPTDVTLPLPAADYLERFEGMLVRFNQTLYVTEHFQLGRFGQVVMSSGDRLRQPTSVVAPGAPALALQAQNNLNKIIVDDDLQVQNPDPIKFARGGQPLSAANTLRGGDTATNMVGVMTYTWAGNAASGNAYRLRPIGALGGGVPNFQPTNPRPGALPAANGLRVVGMNLLNFFNTFDGLPDNADNCTNGVGGAATDCRGANTQAEFDRQWPKTVAAILSMSADVVGFNEIENDGYGPDSAIQFLVDKLNAATAPGTYAFINVDANTGQINALGTDAIKVGMIYKPARVTPVGTTAALNSTAFVNGGDSAPRSRPSLAQAFAENSSGARFIVDLNHLKSKGSACDAPDAGDGQGNCNQVRVNAANELVNWLANDPTGTGDPDILLLGDYNSYAKEDPIAVLERGGYTNLVADRLGPDAYSYAFDGQWGYLDYALGSSAMANQVANVGDYHINADEPSVLDYNTDFKTPAQQASLYAPDRFRIADHDPVVVDLNLVKENTPPVADAQQVTTAEDTPAAITLTARDADGDNLTYTVENGPNNGTLSGATPNLTYTPAANFSGSDDFTFAVRDGNGGTATATVTITVTPVNDAPVASNAAITTNEDTSASFTLDASDVDNTGLTYTIVSQPSKGKLTGTPPNLTYTPDANSNGADSFSYKVSDGALDSAIATVTITVNPVNDAPTAKDDTASTKKGKSVTFAVLANDSDIEGDQLTVTAVSGLLNGKVKINANGTLTYTPASKFRGVERFTYTVSDGRGGTATATVTVRVK